MLAAILRDAPFPRVREMIAEYQQEKQGRHQGFMDLLRGLLEGPFCEQEQRTNNRPGGRPILLIIDDFERALQPPQKGSNAPYTVKPEFVDTIDTVIQAFDSAETYSRLLITIRTAFSLPRNGRDQTGRLLPIPLPPLSENERFKQYENNLALTAAPKWLKDEDIRQRCITAARGNPGLQNLLFNLCAVSRQKSQSVLAEMEAYVASGRAPTGEAEMVQFLHNLALDSLLHLLTEGEKQILRATTLFHLPVPESICRELAGQLVDDPATSTQRLLGFGVWEQFEDLVNPGNKALAVNGIIQPRLKPLTEAETGDLAKRTIESLFHAWGGPAGAGKRIGIVDFELTRLALLAQNGTVLQKTALGAVSWLDGLERPQQAAEVGISAIALIEAAKLTPEIWLYGRASEICQDIGDMPHAQTFIEKALKQLEVTKQAEKDKFVAASMSLRYARIIMQKGEPLKALDYLERSRDDFYKADYKRDYAINLCDIARIKVDRGQVDDALDLHQ